MENQELQKILESLLFVSSSPLTIDQIKKICALDDKKEIQETLGKLDHDLKERGFQLEEIAGGYQLRSNPDCAEWIKRLVDLKPARLSPAALEVLAIVAYRQPITRPGIEEIRGVDCGGVLKTLMEKDLIKTIGKLEEPGHPILYGTTKDFLEVFGLKRISDLPTLKEFQELTPEESERLHFIQPLSKEEMQDMPSQEGFMEPPKTSSSTESSLD